MTFADFSSQVKIESQLEAATQFDTLIQNLTLEATRNAARKYDYADYLVNDNTVTVTVNQNYISLPSDFLRFNKDAILQFDDGTTTFPLLVATNPRKKLQLTGNPKYYLWSASKLYLYPTPATLGQKVRFSYYRLPQLYSEAIPDTIVDFVRNKVLTRLLLHKDSKMAAAYASMAKEVEGASLEQK